MQYIVCVKMRYTKEAICSYRAANDIYLPL